MDLGKITGSIEIDSAKAEKNLDAITSALEQVEKTRPEVVVDADASAAEKKLGAVESFLSGVLDGMRAEVEVDGDTAAAESAIKVVEGMLDGIDAEKATLKVDADTSGAEQGIDDVADKAAAAGDEAGGDMGEGMAAGILAGLASIPIAGAVVKIGQAVVGGIVDGIRSGLQQEVTVDMFSAQTGLDAATAAKFGAAAGQAYADVFGESVEDNLQVARDALQKGLIDPDASSGAIQEIVGQLQTLSQVTEEETSAITTAVDRMLTTGIADSATQAFDVLVAGVQHGINASDDLLDTFTEYSGIFDALGLSAAEALGLLNQGMEAGARNSDLVADALKEFSIRAIDASESTSDAFEAIGLDADEMAAKIASGGEGAKEGLDQVLDALRSIEDPVARNAAGVALFGTMWEDMAGQVAQLDVSSAVSGLGEIEGSLADAMAAIADNPATAIEKAQREIETALNGIKGALATAFSEPLTNLADWASGNQAGVLRAFQAISDGIFDMAEGGIQAVASLIEATGQIPGALEPVLWHMTNIAVSWNSVAEMVPGMPEIPQSVINSLATGAAEAGNFEEKANAAADKVRTLADVLDERQAELNATLEVKIDDAALSDAMARVDQIVLAIDDAGGTIRIDADSTPAGTTLGQLVGNIDESTGTVMIDGNPVPANLTVEQLMALISGSAGSVTIDGKDYAAQEVLGALLGKIHVSGDSIWIGADADDAYAVLGGFLNSIPSSVSVAIRGIPMLGAFGAAVSALGNADGGAIERADGGAVVGPGGPRDDLVPALNVDTGQAYALSNGEHVLTADDVLDLGGQQGAYMLRAMIQAGMVKPLEHARGLAGGGGLGATPAPSVSVPREMTLVVDGRPMRAYIAEGVEASMVDMVRSAR